MEKEMLIKLGISFVAMYLLMYTMIDGLNDFYININQVYMPGA